MQEEVVGLGYISVPALMQYVRSAEAAGLDRDRLLLEAGIRAELLVDNNGRLEGDVLQNLLQYILPRCANPLFGLYTSQYIQPSSYSIMGYIAMTSNNLAEVLSRMIMYERLVGDMGTSSIVHEPGAVAVVWNCRFTDLRIRRHIVENVLASWVVYTRWIADEPDRSPQAVRFEHDPPEDRALLKHYQQVFRCPVYFNQPHSALVASPSMMNLRLRAPDVLLRDTLEQHAQQLLKSIKDSYRLSEQVKTLLRSMLSDGSPRKEFVAQQMGMNVRTLHRKLAEENTSYQQILDQLRHELALRYLLREDLSVEETGRRLGFAESRSFIRHFKGMQGKTPGEYRQEFKVGALAESLAKEQN